MNVLNKIGVFSFAVLFSCISLSAAGTKPYYVTKSGRAVRVDKITLDKRGAIKVKMGQVTKPIRSGQYKYAWVPMPASVSAALKDYKSKKYSSAAQKFSGAYAAYKQLGWGAFCAYYAGVCFVLDKKYSDAVAILTQLTSPPPNPKNLKYYIAARKTLAEAYYRKGAYSQAARIAEGLEKIDSPSIQMFANNIMARVFLKKKNTKDALLMYMRTIFLHDASNQRERPEALVAVIKILRSEKNNKAIEFEKILKQDYGSKYLKDL